MTVSTAALIAAALARRPAKILACQASVHPATVQRWQRGETVPDAVALVRLMAADASIFDAIARLAGRPTTGLAAEVEDHLRAALLAIGRDA